jgi:YYY domain-containing protein
VFDALLFWLLVVGVGIAALPLAELLFSRLPSRGLVFALPLGLLAAAFPIWLLASLHVVPYRRGTALASVLLLVGLGALLRWRGFGRVGRGVAGTRLWLAGQAVFTVAFFGWALLRSFEPAVWQTEKPMDMALVNVVNKSEWFPPHDPWQSGTDVNYYYFGHYLVAFLVRITGIDPAVGFNLAVAMFYALVTLAVFGAAAVLYEAARRSGDAPARSPILVGLTAAAFATAIGNIAGGFQLLHHTSRWDSYDWWAPSRVIEGTANEFPFFSFLLADLHAHVMVTPFALVSVAYAVQLGVHGPPDWNRRAWRRPAAELALAALVLGSLYALNSFDFPTGCAIGLGALLIWALEEPGRWRRALAWGGAWVALAVILFLPFWHGFSPPATRLGTVREHVNFSRFARDYFYIYGVSLWVVLALFAGRFRVQRKYLAWGAAASLFLLVLLAPSRLSGLTVALVVAAAAAFVALGSGRLSLPYRVLWLLTAIALALVVSGEFVYLRDAFDGTESFRFNTVFKTGYQAWFLLAIVAGVGVYWSARWLGRRVRIVWLTGLVALLVLTFAYPVFASYSRLLHFEQSPTLDGMKWLERSAPDDAKAIEWMRTSISGAPTILEQVGSDFDPDGRGRVSTYTGLPTVLAWPGHEVQWGHDPGSRAADVQQIYGTTNVKAARRLLDEYSVRYVFVGTLERKDYRAAALAKFARLGTPVFRSGDTVVYQLKA